jgi:uncharacterized protein
MITPETFSTLHRLPGAEIFHCYLGGLVPMLQLLTDRSARTITLGSDLSSRSQPQVLVRGGVWQGSRLAPGGNFALMGTTMSPGFDLADYGHGNTDQLSAPYPSQEGMIRTYKKD